MLPLGLLLLVVMLLLLTLLDPQKLKMLAQWVAHMAE